MKFVDRFRFISFSSQEDVFLLTASVMITLIFSYPLAYWSQVQAAAVTLTATVSTSLTFTTTMAAGDQFGTITPGTAKFATTTLSVVTNDTSGWIVSLSGDQKNTQPQNNLQLTGATSTQIADQTEWVPGTATTSAGNAAQISSLVSSGNVLAFRVMSASSTNSVGFFATTWWGTADTYVTNANTLWAGIASSTVQRTIGNAGTGTYSATAHLNTVLYYLNVPLTQQTGVYNAPLTFTATGN